MAIIVQTFSSIRTAELNLEVYRGDTAIFLISFFEDELRTIPFDLSPYTGTLKMQVKININEPRFLEELTETTGLTIQGNDNNELEIVGGKIQSDRPAGEFFYDIQGTDTDAEILTILRGKLITIEDVTR